MTSDEFLAKSQARARARAARLLVLHVFGSEVLVADYDASNLSFAAPIKAISPVPNSDRPEGSGVGIALGLNPDCEMRVAPGTRLPSASYTLAPVMLAVLAKLTLSEHEGFSEPVREVHGPAIVAKSKYKSALPLMIGVEIKKDVAVLPDVVAQEAVKQGIKVRVEY